MLNSQTISPTPTTPHTTSSNPLHARLLAFLKGRFLLLVKGATAAEDEAVRGLLALLPPPPPPPPLVTQTTEFVGTPTVHADSTHWCVVLLFYYTLLTQILLGCVGLCLFWQDSQCSWSL